ncbi:MAG: gluconate 2-dehydrogenase subunit 3 family protein [Gammaproteobacteria bacterium]
MIRARHPHRPAHAAPAADAITAWRGELLTRRQVLLGLAGGSLAALMPTGLRAAEVDEWAVMNAVLNHLFPSEAGAPGATEINALAYLRFVVDDDSIDKAERDFLLQGTRWLEDLSRKQHGSGFVALDEGRREEILRGIETSEAGENWLSSVMTYLMEALLTDPVYGGNPDGIGWRWLGHIPGFPRPDAAHTFDRLLRDKARG